MEAADDRVEAAQAALAEAEARRSALAAGEDAASREAILALESAIGAQSLRTLREEASRTPTRDDDAIVARLEVAAAERARLERTLHDAQAQAGAARRRLSEMQTLRHEMRSRGVERSEWGFASGALIGVLVGEVLRGALSRDGFWDRMERHRTPDMRRGTSQPGPWGQPLPGPWDKPAPGPWAGGSGGSDGSWWGGGASPGWGAPARPSAVAAGRSSPVAGAMPAADSRPAAKATRAAASAPAGRSDRRPTFQAGGTILRSPHNQRVTTGAPS